ncbi:folylpolyglutamate synthase/dihydrofolate synthase family protein [Phenylobacterium sp.]|uniref:bifunctional folylpolyglutamate synthase/dihydrofolate synthase n=1 Tax=Phenylobacterium sp. TaxID=1871053 RepID=UPI0027303AA7|nr:folylpolyglutamate synthase/dihydrofolate synthase family protein [Phenylobacterium sp.]MDP1873539.1 folylpolyglutamate synthase/dihydrofolate synthase family protein [Phenylobacterium sp.]
MYDPIRASDAVIARLRANHPSLIDLTTGRVERLLAVLGHPERRLPPVIHVAGTNGKGSTVAYMRAMAEAAGLRVHVLTSPHLVRFAERIRVAGELVTDERLEALIAEVEAANAGEPISFFEITTVLALQAFAQTPADLCLIEVGLGGRFDATNIFEAPALSVITPVDYDHLEMLGPELSKIAWEKAGIIKAGRPVVVARQMDEALAVIEAEAQTLAAPMTLIGADADAWEADGRLLVQWGEQLLDLPPPSLFGAHQFDNAGLAVCALLTLGDPRIDEDAMARGVATAQWPARFQRLRDGALGQMAAERGAVLWLDGGHNPHAGAALAQALARLSARDPRPVVLIAAMFARKDAQGFFAPFAELAPRVVATSFDSANAAPAEEIAAAARAAGLEAQTAVDVTSALAAALALEGPAPHILICGGLHFAGEVLAMDPETWPR